LREERGLRVFESRMLRIIFGPMSYEVTGYWRNLHSEELNDLYSSPTIRVMKQRKIRWEEHAARMGETKGVYKVLVGKPKGKRPLGRTSCRWEDNIKRIFRMWDGGGMDRIYLARDRDMWRELVNGVIEHSGSIKYGEFLD